MEPKVFVISAGAVGESLMNIDISTGKGALAGDGDVLPSGEVTGYEDVMTAANSSLQNMDVLLKRLDRIIAFVESGQGSVGKLIYDPSLYNRVNTTVTEFQKLVSEISEGQGSLGKLIADDELYQKANATVDKVNKLIDDLNAGNGTAGKSPKNPTPLNNTNPQGAQEKKRNQDHITGESAVGENVKKHESFDRKQ